MPFHRAGDMYCLAFNTRLTYRYADPLNYPLWRRDLITSILCLASVIASTLSPLLAANTLSMVLYYNSPASPGDPRPPQRSFTDVALLTGYHLLGVGVAGFVFVASARIWGKRHLYLLGTVIIIVSSAWAGASGRNYGSLLAARFFQGVGLAPFEALVNASVGDLYFVHERGKRMAVSNLAVFGGAFLTPVIVGKMTASLGWQWTHYFVAIFAAAMLPLLFLLVPETAFKRDANLNTDTAMITVSTPHSNSSTEKQPQTATTPSTPPTFPPPRPLLSLHHPLFAPRLTPTPFPRLLLRPFPLFLHPSILLSCLLQGTLIGWTVLIGIVLAAIMIGPPLFFNEVQTGYMYTGASLGALVGFVLAGALADSVPRWLAKRNKGVFEPEFRLVLVVPQLLLGCGGLYGFGVTAADTGRYGWFWPDFCFALVVAGMVLGAVASALYVVDAHREVAVEGFTCLLVFKNVYSFGLTFSGYEWLVRGGVREVFVAVGSVQVGICCLAGVLCEYFFSSSFLCLSYRGC